MNQIQAKVLSVSAPIKGISRERGRSVDYSLVISFECPEISDEAKPGQFVMVRCGDDDTILPRPFSINRADNGTISLYIAVLENGKGTKWLAERHAGDIVTILGPLGNGFTLDDNDGSILLLGGGMGIAPLVFLAEEATRKSVHTHLLYGVPGHDRYPLEGLLPGVDVEIATEDGSEGHHGLITELLSNYVDNVDHVYICGPAAMYKYIRKNRTQLLKDKPVSVSLETRMACGRGICYGCTIMTENGLKRVCEHGPVFDLDELKI